MKTDLKNYTSQPDPEVWERIQKTMHHRAMRRRLAKGAASAVALVAVIVAAALYLIPRQEAAPLQADPLPLVAQNQPSEVTTPAEALPTATPEPAAMRPVSISEPAPSKVMAASEPVPSSQPAAMPISQRTQAVAEPIAVAPVAAPTPAATIGKSINPVPQAEEPAPLADIETDAEAPADEPIMPTAKSTSSNHLQDTILWIPNAFAPSSDDPAISTFKVGLTQPHTAISDYRILIFNRQGHMVYRSYDINQSWDGTYQGRRLPQSTYVYMIQYTDSEQIKHQLKGTVTLIR